MRGVVTAVLVAVLVGAVLWVANLRWGLVSQPTPTPSARVVSTPDQGDWREAPELIGTLYLAACHDWGETYTALRPVPSALLDAVSRSWPERPHIEGFIALSKPVTIPRMSGNVAEDVNAWLAEHASAVDCTNDIWTDADAQAIRGERHIAFFGMTRPTQEGGPAGIREYKPVWEMAFVAVRWK